MTGVPDSSLPGLDVPVERVELVTSDIDALTDLLGHTYTRYRARFRRIAGAHAVASAHAATAASVRSGAVCMPGIEYQTGEVHINGEAVGLVAVEGGGEMTSGSERHSFRAGDVCLAPPDRHYAMRGQHLSVELLQIPVSWAALMAETHTGLPAADFRFESMAPLSSAAADMFARTVAFGRQVLADSGRPVTSALVARELTRMTAAVMLQVFPSNAMRLSYVRGPGRVAPSAAARAAAYMEANADQPITLGEIADAAEVATRALHYGFHRHYKTTPTGYLRKLRLEHAHRELQAADPANGLTVAAVARKWGWPNPAHFAALYRRHYGQLPAIPDVSGVPDEGLEQALRRSFHSR